MTTLKYPRSLIVLTLLMVGCGQTTMHNKPNQIDTIQTVKNESIGQHRDFLSTNLVFNINGISVLDTFELEKYMDVLGQPDSIKKGGPEIIEEFGHDDYDLWYGENWINAGHGYILTADIKKAGIPFNGIQVGDNRQKIENMFNIAANSNKDTIKVINPNDDVLTFYLKNNFIQRIYFWRPL
jgi:hypothetical protein